MTRTWRLALLLLPAVLGLLPAVRPGQAQEGVSARFAFSDTTLLRDTLGLHFNRLFPLADSLNLAPDTLRALAIRYRWTLPRLVHLADSLRMPVDSVGVYLQRERFNPLAGAAGQHSRTFSYNSTYNIAERSTVWGNALDYKLVSGPIFIQNTTNVQLDRASYVLQTRSTTNEAGWKLSKGLSVGARANLDRFTAPDRADSKDEYQLSMRSRQSPARGLTSELNFFSGVLDVNEQDQVKRGASGDLNGTLRFQSPLVTHDLTGQVNGNLARIQPVESPTSMRTSDLSTNLRGTLGVASGAPVGLNVSYVLRRSRVETLARTVVVDTLPSAATGSDTTLERAVYSVSSQRTSNGSVDATLRMRRSNDQYVNLTAHLGLQHTQLASGVNSLSNRRDLGLGADGRTTLAGCEVQSRFSLTRSRSEYPRRSQDRVTKEYSGYGDSSRSATIDVGVSRVLAGRFVLRATGNVGLTQSRTFIVYGRYSSPPQNRDAYHQDYRLEGQYNASEKWNTALTLAVGRDVVVNLKAANANQNSEARSYRAEWRWSYRLMRGLTAIQNNSVTAAYSHYPFQSKNDQLGLDYNTLTTLNAVLSPRFSMDVRHNARNHSGGSYTLLSDGLGYLSRSETNDNYTLAARLSYAPSGAFSLYMEPNYVAGQQGGTQSGTLAPILQNRELTYSAGASLNLKVGGKGRVTGDISRGYRGVRSVSYTGREGGVSENDYWTGSLQFAWDL